MVKRSDLGDEEVLAAIRTSKAMPYDERPFPYELLADRYPAKVVLAKMDQMVSRGLLDYGVSLRTAWIVGEE